MNEEYISNIQTKSGSEKKAIYHTLEIWKLESWFASSSLRRLLFLLQMQETLLTWRISTKEVDSCVSNSSSRSESSVVPSSAIKNLSLPLYGSGKKQSKVGVNNTNTRSSESLNNESSGDYWTHFNLNCQSNFTPFYVFQTGKFMEQDGFSFCPMFHNSFTMSKVADTIF